MRSERQYKNGEYPVKPSEIIKGDYVKRIVFLILLVLILSTGVSFVLYLNIHQSLDTHYSAILIIMTDLKAELITQSLTISALCSFITIVGILCLGIFYTHRVVGPLYKIKIDARSIGNGHLNTKITLRRKDVLHPFAESLNTMTDSYRKGVKDLSLQVNNLKNTIVELDSPSVEAKERDGKIKKIMDIDRHIQSLIGKRRL